VLSCVRECAIAASAIVDGDLDEILRLLRHAVHVLKDLGYTLAHDPVEE
jgi:hypothetical protein